MHDASFLRDGEHDGNTRVSYIDEVRVLGLVLLLVGGDGPLAEVIDLFVHVVVDLACRRCGPAA